MRNSFPSTVAECLNYYSKLLESKNISDARTNIEFMLCEILSCDRAGLYLNSDKLLSDEEITTFRGFLARRIDHEPLQHILGKTSFYGFDFIVNNKVLIPRPETEILVERIIKDIENSKRNKISIFEIGCGSGCISIALAGSLLKKNIHFEILSIDKSAEALQVAKENLKLNNLEGKNIRFQEKNLFGIDKLTREFDYIISNPPYISSDDYEKLDPEVRDYEPEIALTDKVNGLKFFERIFFLAADKGFKGKLFCEIGYGQKNKIENLLINNNLMDYSFYKDYNDTYRILEVRK